MEKNDFLLVLDLILICIFSVAFYSTLLSERILTSMLFLVLVLVLSFSLLYQSHSTGKKRGARKTYKDEANSGDDAHE